MRRGHSDDDGGAPERNWGSEEQKSYVGKGKNRAKPIVRRVVEEEEEEGPTIGESSRDIIAPILAPVVPAPVSRVTRSRTTQALATRRGIAFTMFLNMPIHVFQHVACNLPLSRLLMIRCTSKVVLNMFLENDVEGDERMLLWHIACACLTVSIPQLVSFQPLRGEVSRLSPFNYDCLYHIVTVATGFFHSGSGTRMDGLMVRYRDLFPSSSYVLPNDVRNWMFCHVHNQLFGGAPADTLAVLRHAGFFCTKRSRDRLIRGLRPLLRYFSRPNVPNPELRPIFNFMVELVEESYGLSYIHLDSRLWADVVNNPPIAPRGPVFTLVVDIRREDVDRLNAKYGLQLRFDP